MHHTISNYFLLLQWVLRYNKIKYETFERDKLSKRAYFYSQL